MTTKIIIFFLSFLSSISFAATPASRYFYTGDGSINITSAKNGISFKGAYRKDGIYNDAALKTINRIFGAKYGDPPSEISIRFIEFLDYLENHFRPGAKITVVSGFRSPTYNTKLRANGKLAAKASLHQYGMAADLKIDGVPSDIVWNYVKELGFGGAGFYHGALVHVDVGPARSWDEATSGVGTDISEENKLIDIITDKDIYLPGEKIGFRFTRMTMFPIGVSQNFVLEKQVKEEVWKKMSVITRSASDAALPCPKFNSIEEMANFSLVLPKDIATGRYRIKATFCDKTSDAMPDEIITPNFTVIPE